MGIFIRIDSIRQTLNSIRPTFSKSSFGFDSIRLALNSTRLDSTYFFKTSIRNRFDSAESNRIESNRIIRLFDSVSLSVAEPYFFSTPDPVTLDHHNRSSSKFMFESMRSEYTFDKSFSLIGWQGKKIIF